MFSTQNDAVLARLVCPFRTEGFCTRPHCPFKHEKNLPISAPYNQVDVWDASLDNTSLEEEGAKLDQFDSSQINNTFEGDELIIDKLGDFKMKFSKIQNFYIFIGQNYNMFRLSLSTQTDTRTQNSVFDQDQTRNLGIHTKLVKNDKRMKFKSIFI